jgi:hypothetical protein
VPTTDAGVAPGAAVRSGRGQHTLAAAAALAGGVVLLPSPASAQGLDSSALSVRVGQDSVDATVSIALETLDPALGTASAATADTASYADEVVAYLDEHLTVTGADGAAWTGTYSDVVRESVEGIESLGVDVTLDPGSADPSGFTITCDAIIEADPTHEAVVVLTDVAGDISGCSTAGDPAARGPDVPAGGRRGRAQLTAPAGRPVRGRARAAPSPAASTAVVTAKAAW